MTGDVELFGVDQAVHEKVMAEAERIKALGEAAERLAKAVEGLAPRKRPSRNPEMHLAGLEPFTIAA